MQGSSRGEANDQCLDMVLVKKVGEIMRKYSSIILLVIAIFLGLFLGYYQCLPPQAPKDLDETPISLAEAKQEADLQLMLTHIREMAGEVHSVGSPGLARTQAYLKNQLTAMGYTYTEDTYRLSVEEVRDLLQVWFANAGYSGLPTTEEIRDRAGLCQEDEMLLNNILVHVDAPDTDETIVFMAHTDSVIQGPGAFDDIVSVAALLEGMRAVQDKEIARDLLFLFTDGEEQGLLGAAKFIADHPEYKDRTRLVVNLEARGNAGALILFQTTDNNLELIKTYRQAVPYPFSTSFATAVYKTMPNDTDLTHFIHAGYPGINLAAIEGSHVYHTELDNYETFSRDSAYHYLTTTVGLVTHLALTPELRLEADQDAVHFPFFPGKLAVIPMNIANVLAHVALVLTLLCLFYLLWKKSIRLSDLLLTAAGQILLLALSGGLTWAILEVMYMANRRYGLFSELLITFDYYGRQSHILLVLLFLVSMALAVLVFSFVRRRTLRYSSDENPYVHLIGVLVLPAFLGEACVWLFPAVTYLFSLPVLAALLALGINLVFPKLTPVFAALSIFLTLLLYTPLVYLLHMALLIYMAYVTLPVAMLALTLVGGTVGFTWEGAKPKGQ